jgi:RimJ/RimL family protein N-acetyltransferase
VTTRSIRPEELQAVCGHGRDSDLLRVTQVLWQEGSSSPDACFVAEDQGRLVGRAFFHRRRSAGEYHLFGFHVDRVADFFTGGKDLLQSAIARLAGAKRISYAIYDIYHKDPVRMQQLIESVGLRQYQEKRRYVWSDTGSAVVVPARLSFRSLADVGEVAFTDAARRVTEGTLDEDDRQDLAKYGLEAAGRMYVALLKEIEYLPDEWQLGFLPDGRLCGLIVPQRIPINDEGAINYIGVVPELRGSGHGLDFLLKGTALLQRRGLKTVVGETDVENRPMHGHFESAGYRHEGTLRVFSLHLPQPKAG